MLSLTYSLSKFWKFLLLVLLSFALQSLPIEALDLLDERAFIEGRYQPVTVRYDATPEARALLFQMPDWVLPYTPMGYKWFRETTGQLVLKKHPVAPDHDIQVVIYGPDHNNRINFIELVDGRNYQSFASICPRGQEFRDTVRKSGRRYPINERDFDVLFQDGSVLEFIRGHCIDLLDTIAVGKSLKLRERIKPIPVHDLPLPTGRYYSTFDRRAYLPEPKTWGETIRNHYVNDHIRPTGGYYLQYPYYDEDNLLFTRNGTAVPEGVAFVGIKGTTVESFDVSWDYPYDTPVPPTDTLTSFYLKQFQDNYIPVPLVHSWNMSNRAVLDYVNLTSAQFRKVGR